MTRKFSLLLFAVLITSSCAVPEKEQDKKIKRIISLSPHITELFYALGQQDKLVGVTDFCTYPQDALGKEKIGGLLNPNLEKMIALQPDMLIGTPASRELAAKLRPHNTDFVFLTNDRLQDVYVTIDSLGSLLDCKSEADSLKKLLMDSLTFYSQLVKRKFNRQPAALLAIGREAGSTRNIMAVGAGTFISEVWKKTGGRNAFDDLPASYAQVNRESLLSRQPDLIIEFKFKEAWNEDKNTRNLAEWKELENLQAVAKKNIYVITGDYSLIPGPRLYLLARDFHQIHKRYLKNSPLFDIGFMRKIWPPKAPNPPKRQ